VKIRLPSRIFQGKGKKTLEAKIERGKESFLGIRAEGRPRTMSRDVKETCCDSKEVKEGRGNSETYSRSSVQTGKGRIA